MQSKEKRKINPRRRLLMHLILAIVVIAILLVLGLRAVKPKGAQIVYIAPDENGYDAIWLADLNDPENPRQLTFHEGMFIRDLQVSEENSMAYYYVFSNNPQQSESWIISLDTGQRQQLELCETGSCGDYQLHPNGRWLTFEDYSKPSNKIYVYDLSTSEEYLVFDFGIGHLYSHSPNWVGNTTLLVFRKISDGDYDKFALYSISEHQIIDILTLDSSTGSPHFSHNGIFYEYYLDHSEASTGQLRDINRTELIHSIPYPVYDWHPNNEELLMVDYIYSYDPNDSSVIADIYLFDMLTGDYEILLSVENSYPQPVFNADGSLILYTDYMPEIHLMLFDMETREEITLPIVGRDPQWVNGGR